jgi:hypothetical protein
MKTTRHKLLFAILDSWQEQIILFVPFHLLVL